MTEKRRALEDAKQQIEVALSSWAYTPPECESDLYYRTAANVLNTLDPEGVLIQKLLRSHRPPRDDGPDYGMVAR